MLSINHVTGAHGRTNRRNFLRIGTLALGGLTLADLLRSRAAGSGQARSKSVVMIHLSGGAYVSRSRRPSAVHSRRPRTNYRSALKRYSRKHSVEITWASGRHAPIEGYRRTHRRLRLK